MESTALAAGEFKATCLALMDEVAATGREVIITKRGKPVAKLVAVTQPVLDGPVFGCLRDVTEILGDIEIPMAAYEFDSIKKWNQLEREAEERIRIRAPRNSARAARKAAAA